MNRDSLRQALRVHVMRLRQQQLRAPCDTTSATANGGFFVSCTVDELVLQVEGALSTEKPDYGFGEALARLQLILGVKNTNNTSNSSLSSHRRGSIGAGSGRRGSISDMIDAEAMVSRHSLKSIA